MSARQLPGASAPQLRGSASPGRPHAEWRLPSPELRPGTGSSTNGIFKFGWILDEPRNRVFKKARQVRGSVDRMNVLTAGSFCHWLSFVDRGSQPYRGNSSTIIG